MKQWSQTRKKLLLMHLRSTAVKNYNSIVCSKKFSVQRRHLFSVLHSSFGWGRWASSSPPPAPPPPPYCGAGSGPAFPVVAGCLVHCAERTETLLVNKQTTYCTPTDIHVPLWLWPYISAAEPKLFKFSTAMFPYFGSSPTVYCFFPELGTQQCFRFATTTTLQRM